MYPFSFQAAAAGGAAVRRASVASTAVALCRPAGRARTQPVSCLPAHSLCAQLGAAGGRDWHAALTWLCPAAFLWGCRSARVTNRTAVAVAAAAGGGGLEVCVNLTIRVNYCTPYRNRMAPAGRLATLLPFGAFCLVHQ